MKIPVLFKEYIWLIDTIWQSGRITFAEINEKWQRREGNNNVNFSRTTFNRHRDAILDMFGIIIECDINDGYRYYIYNKEELRGNSISNWLYSTLSVGNMLDENVSLQDRILLESIPSGDIHLKRITRAMREERKILLKYQKYGTTTTKPYVAEPYCVKLFKRRWYVLAKMDRPSYNQEEGKNYSMAVFSLDRIENVELQQAKFVMDPDFDASEYFGECFGIVVGDGTLPERIVLRAYGLEPHYLRDLPLHHSQREINATEEYTDFELYMRPTSDFKGHLMSRGEWLQVISPKWLAEDVQNWLQAAMNRYKNEKNEE
jgi:hypothetical protein